MWSDVLVVLMSERLDLGLGVEWKKSADATDRV